MTSPTPERSPWLVRGGIASIWLLTGLLVVHPHYRAIGAAYLDRLGLVGDAGVALMLVACAGEVGLGLWVLLGRPTTAQTLLQVGGVLFFTTVLAAVEPALLVHPMGVLTKNLPLLALVLVSWLLEREGLTPRAARLLRVGAALPWLTEGLLPKVLFQGAYEREVVARSGLVPIDPGAFLVLLGLGQLAAGLLVLTLAGRPLRWLLTLLVAALVVLPALVSFPEPLLWVHPFGPLTKNLPIIAVTLFARRRLP